MLSDVTPRKEFAGLTWERAGGNWVGAQGLPRIDMGNKELTLTSQFGILSANENDVCITKLI